MNTFVNVRILPAIGGERKAIMARQNESSPWVQVESILDSTPPPPESDMSVHKPESVAFAERLEANDIERAATVYDMTMDFGSDGPKSWPMHGITSRTAYDAVAAAMTKRDGTGGGAPRVNLDGTLPVFVLFDGDYFPVEAVTKQEDVPELGTIIVMHVERRTPQGYLPPDWWTDAKDAASGLVPFLTSDEKGEAQ